MERIIKSCSEQYKTASLDLVKKFLPNTKIPKKENWFDRW